MDLDERAREILRQNDQGGYTLPTHGLYPYQWNWDSAFAAWGFATFDIKRAWDEIDTLLASIWDDGMVPHIIFHQQDPGYFPGPEVWGTGQTPETSGITQPPVAAITTRLIWETDPDYGASRIKPVYDRLVRWHRWWHEVRCQHGPAVIIHPWESGRDNCPDWDVGMSGVDGSHVGNYTRRDTDHIDAEMRPKKQDYDRYIALIQFGRSVGWDQRRIVNEGPFLMADPGITFILLRAHEDLIELGKAIGEDTSEIEGWAKALRHALPTLWNDELNAYDAKDMRTGQFAGVLGSGAFLAYLAGAERDALNKRLIRAWDSVKYGIPSADPETEFFDPRRYWRGPSWPVVNALIALGFRRGGYHDLEARLRKETVELITENGFFEYFDPTDGTPCGGRDFTWTAAIWLTWANADPEQFDRAALRGAA